MKPSHSKNKELADQVNALAKELNLAVVHNASSLHRFDGYHRYLVGDLPAEGMTIRSKRCACYWETRYHRCYQPSAQGEEHCLLNVLDFLEAIRLNRLIAVA